MDAHKLQVIITANKKPFKDACSKIKKEVQQTADTTNQAFKKNGLGQIIKESAQETIQENKKQKLSFKDLASAVSESYAEIRQASKKNKAENLQKKIDYGYLSMKGSAKSELKGIATEITRIEDKAISASAELSNLRKGGQGSSARANALKAELDGYKKQLSSLYGRQDSITSSSKSYESTGKLTNGQKIFEGIKKGAGGFGNAIKSAVSKSGSALMALHKKSQSLGKSMFRVGLMFALGGRLIAGVINAIKTGFNNLVKNSETANNTISQLRSSLGNLKNSFATAFSPILTYVQPALTGLMDTISGLLTQLAHLFSALTGAGTVTVATKQVENYADSLKGAKSQLMGFDKINKLNADSGTGTFSTFSEENVSSSAKSLADRLKEAWAGGDFTSFGDSIATKINEAMDSINWTSIQAGFNKVASSIGTFINGAVRTLDWSTLGKTISNGIKTVFDGISTFLETVNWKNVGKAIVDFFTGIDWAGLFKSAFRTLGGIAGGIAGIIAGAVGDALEAGKSYFKGKIEECGGNIVAGIFKGITDGLKSIGKWVKDNILTPFITAFKSAFGIASPSTVMATQGGFIISGLLQGMKDKFEEVKTWLATLPTKIKNAIGDGTNILKNLAYNMWKGFKEYFTGKKLNIHIEYVEPKTTAQKAIKKIFNLSGYPQLKFYSQGGFPEEGAFFMNRGEIAGKFSNGKSVVANNQQITDGIAKAVAPAVYSAMVGALSTMDGGSGNVTINCDVDRLFTVIREKSRNYTAQTGKFAF